MPRKSAMVDDPDQAEMFPELDTENKDHKALLRAARLYRRAKQERDEVLSTAKEKTDNARDKVIALMHECGLTKFRSSGVKAEIIGSKEKLQVKIDDEANAVEDAE